MMKHEFERMAGREVTTEQYDAWMTWSCSAGIKKNCTGCGLRLMIF